MALSLLSIFIRIIWFVVFLQSSVEVDFFTEYGEGSRYRIEEVIGKGKISAESLTNQTLQT